MSLYFAFVSLIMSPWIMNIKLYSMLTEFPLRCFRQLFQTPIRGLKSGLNMAMAFSRNEDENPIWMTEIIPYMHIPMPLNAHLLFLSRVGLTPFTDQFSITLIINQQPSTANIMACPERSMAFLFILFFIALSDKPSITPAILSCATRNLNVETYRDISNNNIELVIKVKSDRIRWNSFTESVSRAL